MVLARRFHQSTQRRCNCAACKIRKRHSDTAFDQHLYPIDGAAHRVGKRETAFSYRDANWAEVIVGVDPDARNVERIIGWTKSYWDALHPHSAGSAYVNFLMDEGQERIKATYRDNYLRLSEIKRHFDPTNFFRVNQNIRPAD